MRLVSLLFLLAFAGKQYAAEPALAQRQMERANLAPGLFLIAPRQPADDNFAQTVILIISHDDTGTLGLVINRPAGIPVSRVFADVKAARRLTEMAYSGGPVQSNAVLTLSRNRKKINNAVSVLKDVYLISTKTELDQVLHAKPTANNLRVYLGYTGWAPGQLEHEMDLDVWRILPGDEENVFDPDPSKVWPRLIERTELQFARLFHSPPVEPASIMAHH